MNSFLLGRNLTGSFLSACVAVAFTLFAQGPVCAQGPTVAAISAAANVNPDNPDLAGHFSGVVLGPEGKPFAGAQVCVVPISKNLSGKMVRAEELGLTRIRAKTDADGRFDIHAPDVTLMDLDGLPTNRLCLVIATAEGYGPDWTHVRGRTRSSIIRKPSRSTNLQLQLTDDNVPIAGRILGPDGKPLAGALVQATTIMIPKNGDLSAHLDREIKKSLHSGFLSGSSVYEREFYFYSEFFPNTANTRTDADGKFTLAGIGRDRLVRLKISAPSVVDTSLTTMTRAVPDVLTRTGGKVQIAEEHREYYLIHGARFTRQLKPGRTIKGTVIDAQSRQPIPGMFVGLGHDGKPRGGIRSHQTTTDAQGRFTITGIDPWNDKWSVTAVSPPGMTYLPASTMGQGHAPVVIECSRGIPFHLKLADENGNPVTAEVTAYDVSPNPYAPRAHVRPCYIPLSTAVPDADGIYHGFVCPGPGAVLVKTPTIQDYRPASVDPKAFFAPQRKVWTAQEKISSYGTLDTLAISGGITRQDNYAAIVMVNPTINSRDLELTATVFRESPRVVHLLDPAGAPVAGVESTGMTPYPSDFEPPLRAASFPLNRLRADRSRFLIFRKDDRQLIGYLVARRDENTSYTVRMQPWASIKGRFVDETGGPLPLGQKGTIWEHLLKLKVTLPDDRDDAHRLYTQVDREGRFVLGKLIPSQCYSGRVYQDSGQRFRHSAFTDLVLKPGETRDLGDIRLTVQTLAHSDFLHELPRLNP